MPITLGSNIASLKAQRQLGKVTSEVSSVFERLSSGQRINKASDDAAGLAVATSLQNDRRVFTQGIRNYNDGISLLNLADGAVEQLSGIVVRLKELGEQAANGTYGVKQRKALDAEAQALSKEYFRIARSTTFNGRGVFVAEFGELRLQGGYGLDGGIQSGLGGAIGTTQFTGGAGTYTTSSTAVAAADLNNDGHIDLVAANVLGNQLTLRFGRNDGTFENDVTYSMSAAVSEIAIGDVNNDGNMDLIAGGTAAGQSYVSVMLGGGNGTFGPIRSYLAGPNSAAGIALGDLNGDENLDIVTISQFGGSPSIAIMLGKGDGTFHQSATFNPRPLGGGAAHDVALGDVNLDGLLDIVSASGSETQVMLGRGDGSFGAITSFTIAVINDINLGDINGDGMLDIVGAAASGRVAVALGGAGGTFGVATTYITGGTNTFGVELGDINGDGNLDAITAGSGGGISASVLLGRGDGTFTSEITVAGGGGNEIAVADLNGDGVVDLGVASSAGMSIFLARTVNGISPLTPFSLRSRADSLQALSQFDKALNRLSTQRGIIGAFQSRITVAGNVLQASADNYAAAAGRIKDADVADEASKLIRTQILQQAASAVLAQANQQPALALRLLN